MSLIRTTKTGTVEVANNLGIIENNSTSLVNSTISISCQFNFLQVGEVPNSSNVTRSNNDLLSYITREVVALCVLDDQVVNVKEELKIDVCDNDRILTDFLGKIKDKISKIFLWKFQKNFEDYCAENNNNNYHLQDVIALRSEIINLLVNTISHIGSELQNGSRSDDLSYLTDADKILDLWNKLMNEIHRMFNSKDRDK